MILPGAVDGRKGIAVVKAVLHEDTEVIAGDDSGRDNITERGHGVCFGFADWVNVGCAILGLCLFDPPTTVPPPATTTRCSHCTACCRTCRRRRRRPSNHPREDEEKGFGSVRTCGWTEVQQKQMDDQILSQPRTRIHHTRCAVESHAAESWRLSIGALFLFSTSHTNPQTVTKANENLDCVNKETDTLISSCS